MRSTIFVVAATFFAAIASQTKADYCEIDFWDDAGMSGSAAAFYDSVPNVSDLHYWPNSKYPLGRDANDTFSSMVVKSGVWRLCHDAGYEMCGGERRAGEHIANFAGDEWQDTISSVQLVRCDEADDAQSGDAPESNCTVAGTSLLPAHDDTLAQEVNAGKCDYKQFFQ